MAYYVKLLRRCPERPFSLCLAEESAAVRKRPSSSPTRDPGRRRAADHRCGPGTFYHAMTVIAYISVVSPLVGGGLYALRAGRHRL